MGEFSLDSLLGLTSDGHSEQASLSGRHGGAQVQADASAPGLNTLANVDVGLLFANRYQPRTEFSEQGLDELAASIRAVGVLQPIIARPNGDGRYELIAGERRWRAAQRAGLEKVPVLVRTVDDRSALEQAIVENLHRADLSVLEEAAAFQQLIDDFGLTQQQVATQVGRSRSAVTNTLRMLQLPPEVQEMIVAGLLSAGHARALLALPAGSSQVAIAREVVAEELSVRQVEGRVRWLLKQRGKQGAPDDETTVGPSVRSASVVESERLFEEALGTKVEVDWTGGRGRVLIEFADLDDLARICEIVTSSDLDAS